VQNYKAKCKKLIICKYSNRLGRVAWDAEGIGSEIPDLCA